MDVRNNGSDAQLEELKMDCHAISCHRKNFRRVRKEELILKAHAMMVVETINARVSANLW